MAYYVIYSYNYVDDIYVIAWIISGILILSLQLTESSLEILSLVDSGESRMQEALIFKISLG